ncbi:hypothetical protein IB238_09040 [Rhizobium sp. ARZ01]|uniref:hypothetical protein n=1 Tax=Rhizobium sp. ARZ01 TaxID=2769313 RepID=UPI00177BB4F1|nr:hypothetical protein [Rhizobium sp. ARZ01]MBD9372765.1 hypothetical protein [Rhizobium sp. ARZ01]
MLAYETASSPAALRVVAGRYHKGFSMIRDFVLYFFVIGGAIAAVASMVINTGQLVGWW